MEIKIDNNIEFHELPEFSWEELELELELEFLYGSNSRFDYIMEKAQDIEISIVFDTIEIGIDAPPRDIDIDKTITIDN